MHTNQTNIATSVVNETEKSLLHIYQQYKNYNGFNDFYNALALNIHGEPTKILRFIKFVLKNNAADFSTIELLNCKAHLQLKCEDLLLSNHYSRYIYTCVNLSWLNVVIRFLNNKI